MIVGNVTVSATLSSVQNDIPPTPQNEPRQIHG